MEDIIVVLPGILGSVLQKDGQDIWALSGAALLTGLKTLGHNLKALTLSGDSGEVDVVGDGILADRIFPDAHLLPGLWKIDGYSTLVKVITTEFDTRPSLNYFEFPYDWRRDNRVAARRLARLVPGWLKAWRLASGNKDAKLIIIAHSMGVPCVALFPGGTGWMAGHSDVDYIRNALPWITQRAKLPLKRTQEVSWPIGGYRHVKPCPIVYVGVPTIADLPVL